MSKLSGWSGTSEPQWLKRDAAQPLLEEADVEHGEQQEASAGGASHSKAPGGTHK